MIHKNDLRRFLQADDGYTPPLVADRNVYLPRRARVRQVVRENSLVRTLELVFEDQIHSSDFTYLPGQFMMLSLPHCGEAPISFSSSPTRPGGFSLSIRQAGKLTTAAQSLRPGDMVGVRGPYGRPFPMADLRGRNLMFVAGGIGMAPLRSAILYCLDKGDEYGHITVLYGSKNPGEFCFMPDLAAWRQDERVTCLLTVDEGDDDWQGRVGLVTGLLDEVKMDGGRDRALVCGPGVMIRFVLECLAALGFGEDNMITTLERHMKCGVGICGHCHFENKMVCTDGPVFTRSELPDLRKL